MTNKTITMTPDKQLNQAIWWVLQELRKEYLSSPSGQAINFEYQNKGGGNPSPEDQRRALKFLTTKKVIRIGSNNYPAPFNKFAGGSIGAQVYGVKPIGYDIDILQPKFDELYHLYAYGNSYLENKKAVSDTISIKIKDARLDEQNYLLEINNGEKIISFKSKKKGEGLEKETKQFKILYHLWEFRWELKDGKVLKKGDFTSLDNLVRGSGSESTEAAYKHIQRLNKRFKNESVAIEIAGENEKYRLIINKA
ncbi:MAG: hypothetical protein G01um101429_297 [Parcubacteria group bacterium Gr01-1014_29]|nr:MAG: hypothetical protein G01um101429_297 [Parcubacteria group bacterium Gr01-1014_29]